MRLSPPSLLLVACLSAAACTLNSSGLEKNNPGRMDAVGSDGGQAGQAGQAGTDGAGTSGAAGAETAGAGGGGVAGDGLAGDSGSAGTAGTGAAGEGLVGGGAGDMGVAGSGEAGAEGLPDAGGPPDTMSPPDAHPPSVIGCADGTREGFLQLARFPNVAACSGGWTVHGLLAPETKKPQCNRAAGNDGERPDGHGCSVADLCADGWHVCESGHELAAKATNCDEAFPGGAVKMFFASRQRGIDQPVTCDPKNEEGTNNVYGCGNFGSNALAACAPFMHMLRDYDCQNNPPWMCLDGPPNTSNQELDDVTKPGSEHGGVLCCR